MKITVHLSAALPGQPDTTMSVSGDVASVSGVAYDLSGVPEGGSAVPGGDHPFVGTIKRVGGQIEVSVLWSYDPATASPDQGSEHPVFVTTSGAVPDPVQRLEVQQ